VFAVVAWVAVGLVSATYGLAILPAPPPREAVAVVGGGVVWFDDGPVFFKGFHSGSVRLGPIETKEVGRESSVASSASAVAAIAGEGAGRHASGATKPVIGFNSSARSLVALAFRWPVLAVVETMSAPLLPSEVHCWSGEYGPPSKPFLGIFDLARNKPFVPPPALVHVQPSEPLTGCGPAPP
jgi:hypothetical protein